MAGTLYRWYIKMEEATDTGPWQPLLYKQDVIMRQIRDSILSQEWFRGNVDYYALRRNDKDGIGLWFQYIQVRTDLNDIRDNVSSALSGVCVFNQEIYQEKVLTTGDTLYLARTLDEEVMFWRFYTDTTEIALDLLACGADAARQSVLSARLAHANAPSQKVWTQFAIFIQDTPTYQGMDEEERKKYRVSFSKIVNEQHWAHFLCNTVLMADPLYYGKRMPEYFWKRVLGLG